MSGSVLEWYTRLCFARPWPLLAGVLALVGLAALYGRGIEIRTDLAEMLPDNAPSVTALEEARARLGMTEMYTIAVQSPDPLANVAVLRALEDAMRSWDEVEYLEVRHEQAFFREHALLLLPETDLLRIRETLQRMIRDRLAEVNPLYVSLETEGEREAAAAFDWRDPDAWVDPWTLRELGLDETDTRELFPFLDRLDPEHDEIDPTLEQTRDYRLSSDRTVGILMARLKGPHTDVVYAREVFEAGEALIASLDLPSFHPEMHAEVVGAYRSFLEVRAIGRDVQQATWISVVLVVLLLFVFFRDLRAVVIVGLPLLVGILLTLAAVRLLLGQLNTLTAFVFAIVIGIGIDFAIHLHRRVIELLREGHAPPDAVGGALHQMMRPLVVAAATTAIALLTLGLGSFSGFREFGVASAIGVVMCLVSTVLLVPLLGAALLRATGSSGSPAPRPPGAARGARGHLTRRVAVVTLGAIAVLAIVAPAAEFEYDFENLSGPGSGRTIAYEEAIGARRGTAPALMLGESSEQLREAHAWLRERLREGDPLLRSFYTIDNVLPASFDERVALLDDIHEITERRAVRRIGGDEGAVIDKLRTLSEAEPWTADDLPEWARRQMTESDGTFGRVGLLYIDFPRTDAIRMQAFQDAYGAIPTSTGEVRLSSVSFIVADVVRYVQQDGRMLPLWVGSALFLLLLLDLRSLRMALLGVAILGVAALLARALMGIFDVRIGLYNMVVLPMILGLGIDGVIHLVHRARHSPLGNVMEALRTTGVAILASGLTTAAGFVGLLFVGHLGVRSIGALALIGIASVLIAVLLVLPGALTLSPGQAAQPRRPA